jgi:hypothetical protein
MKSVLFIILINYPLVLFAQGNEKSLFVFVGEKVDVTKFDPKPTSEDSSVVVISLDYSFKARYKVIDWVYNRIDTDTVEFEAYYHYGAPGFAHYQYVLLYLVKEEGKLYHSKYLYNALYRTKDERWAGPWTYYDYSHPNNAKTSIKPEEIDFINPVTIDVSEYEPLQIDRRFPASYYRRNETHVIATHGNYIRELFLLKKEGVLKACGYFD